MTLGADNAACKQEFVDAMRPIAGDNVDLPQVQDNLGALGTAVFRIATVHAATVSDAAADAAFWGWIAGVSTWLGSLSTWQQGVKQAVDAWAPTTPAEQGLRTALRALADPGAPPAAAPLSLTGRVT